MVFFVCRAAGILFERAAARLPKREGVGIKRRWIMLAIDGPGLSQRDLCEILNIDQNTMVRTIDDLVKLGYVLRDKNPKNRRTNMIVLTSKGREANREWEEMLEHSFKEIFHPLTKSEVKTLKTLCIKLMNHENAVIEGNL